jgi:hypothetical protein
MHIEILSLHELMDPSSILHDVLRMVYHVAVSSNTK